MTHDLDATMKEKITTALRVVLGQRKEAIRQRLLSCLADHVEQELDDFAESPALDDALFALRLQPGQTPPSLPDGLLALAKDNAQGGSDLFLHRRIAARLRFPLRLEQSGHPA